MSEAENPESLVCGPCAGEGGGYGRHGDEWEWTPCVECRGTGYTPIPATPMSDEEWVPFAEAIGVDPVTGEPTRYPSVTNPSEDQ